MWTPDEDKWAAQRHFLSQRLTRVAFGEAGMAPEARKKRNKAAFDIDEVYGERKPAADPRKGLFKETLAREELLWHNNIPLPYQKKVKKD